MTFFFVREKKLDSFIRSILFSFLVHIVLFGFIVLSITFKPAAFKPQLAFLGSIVVDQNIFGNIGVIEKKNMRAQNPWLTKTPSSSEKNFKLNKPASGIASTSNKSEAKTTFVIKDVSREVHHEQNFDFNPEGYSYSPLRLGTQK
jgi:hypothetical protein